MRANEALDFEGDIKTDISNSTSLFNMEHNVS